MFIIVESGSTKADWLIVNGEQQKALNTIGFNPYFHSEEDILLELNDNLELGLVKDQIDELHFYGAACNEEDLNAKIHDAFSSFFINAKIFISHDLTACAYACYSGVDAICCILGTGSNSCYFDGKTIREEIPALSYILGDEGSGSFFGKKLLADFLYNKLPRPIATELKQMGMNKQTIVENVYLKPSPNVFIASFMPILIRHREIDYAQKLIKEGFQKFIDIHVKCYENYQDAEVSFVGSIASLLEKELRDVCEINGIIVAKIIRRPLDKLAEYHLQELKNRA